MVNWPKIKKEYQKGGIDLRSLAKKHHVSPSTMMQRAAREKWKGEVEARCSKIEAEIVKETVDDSMEWVRKVKKECERILSCVSASVEQAKPLIDPDQLKGFAQSVKSLDDTMRRAYGLPNAPQKLEHTGVLTFADLADKYDDEKDK